MLRKANVDQSKRILQLQDKLSKQECQECKRTQDFDKLREKISQDAKDLRRKEELLNKQTKEANEHKAQSQSQLRDLQTSFDQATQQIQSLNQ